MLYSIVQYITYLENTLLLINRRESTGRLRESGHFDTDIKTNNTNL